MSLLDDDLDGSSRLNDGHLNVDSLGEDYSQ